MEPNFTLTAEDTEGWKQVASNTSIVTMVMYIGPDDDTYQMVFHFPYLPEGGVLEALEVVDKKLVAQNFRKPTPEEMSNINRTMANRVISQLLNRAIEERQAHTAVEEASKGADAFLNYKPEGKPN